MATIIVQRPKLKWHERWFITPLLKGLRITLGHAIAIVTRKKKVTMQYPEEKWDANLPAHYRGAPALVTDEHGRERCVACQLCEFICPPRAITIMPEEIPQQDKWAKVEKRPRAFNIDMIRCIYCGMCEEVCPEQAIFLRKDYAITGLSRAEMVHDKSKLYQIGGVRTGLVNKWNELK
jgi:NADH-quinone oxidoreductase subunit I